MNHRDHHSNENDKTADLKGYHHIPQSSSQNKTHHDEAAEITDPYDPRVPNDLLQYWDRQRLAQEREALEKETREALENQKRLRQRLEKEREELQLTGDYTKILEASSNEVVAVASSGGMGRGRGRGVSNLPAWLVEKQQKEAEELGRT